MANGDSGGRGGSGEMGGHGGHETSGSRGELSASTNSEKTTGTTKETDEKSALNGFKMTEGKEELPTGGETLKEGVETEEPPAETEESVLKDFSMEKGTKAEETSVEHKSELDSFKMEKEPGEKSKGEAEAKLEVAQKNLEERIDRMYEKSPEKAKEMRELLERTQDTTRPIYESSKEVAEKAEAIRDYSEHNMAHIVEVAESALAGTEAMHEYEEAKGAAEEAKVRDDVVLSAALWHDTGMAGKPADLEAVKSDPDAQLDGNRIRSGHSFESAQRVLENQDSFSSQAEALEVAWVACMHSKSNSEVRNMSSDVDMMTAINRVKSEYETGHPDGEKLDLSCFGEVNEKGELVSITDSVRTRINNETLLLRVADAQRPASDVQVTMTGREMHTEKTRYEDTSGFELSAEEEAMGKQVEYIDPENPENSSTRKDATSVKYVSGEANVDAGPISTVKEGDSTKVQVEYVVKDAYVDQAATRDILKGRIAEANSTAAEEFASPGTVAREDIVHVVTIEQGDEAARAALQDVLEKETVKVENRTYIDEKGEKQIAKETISAKVEVRLKEQTAPKTDEGKDD